MEPQLKDSIGELAAEAMAMGILPFTVHDLKCDVLVRRAGVEAQYSKVFVVGTGLEEVLRSRALVDEIRVEDVELVALDDFGRRVVEVVMRLVVFVPLEASVDAVEEARLTRTVFVGPKVHFSSQRHFNAKLGLIVAHALFSETHECIFSAFICITCSRKRQCKLALA